MTQIKSGGMDPFFFGYGSLVNRATHDYPEAQPARARGWRRTWRHIAGRRAAVLAAIPDPDSVIDGLIAAVPAADWQALDRREEAYDRVEAAGQIDHAMGPDTQVAIYTIPVAKHPPAPQKQPVLLSYLDVVIAGYLREFDADAALRFFDTTDGWGTVLDDRADPIYPRHQRLSRSDHDFVDQALVRHGVPRVNRSDVGF
ncbi:gamma-glutamylcyclotransferase family protein [Pseudooceanicola sp.]|uniref:gamma-glutamylcyclotransferase family protein n=1 Tax=Pseudooceanicola sp. TaxID=1914328 RepID=UPI0026150DCF|nr:gamma-glutamylcyclotransferase family protein [Pseudooceanicola sp.]MDF1855976.1 gamma-glutamylcyclotransferase [Pseudooceanicola sp.]